VKENKKKLGNPKNVIFKEPPDELDENWFGVLIGTFGGYRDFFSVAQSFKNAANCLIDTHKNNFHEDEILDPLLYLFRHALELYMKALIVTYDNACDVKAIYGHSLDKLFSRVEDVISSLGYYIPQKAKNIIDEFNEIDSGAFSFRYDGEWCSDEYWIGYYNLKDDLNWVFEGLEKAYHLVSIN
jgi:hypothetical protein